MADFKVTFVFNSGRNGWSETWHWTGTDIGTGYDRALSLSVQRKNLLGGYTYLEGFRISNVAVLGDALVKSFVNEGGPADFPHDTPYNAILCRCEATSLYRRAVWLRGVPDDWIIVLPNGTISDIAPFKPKIDAFKNALKNNGWCLRVIQKDGPGAVVYLITGYLADANGYTILTIPGGVPTSVGEKIRMFGWEGPDAEILNKVYKVRDFDGASVTINLPFALITQPAPANFNGVLKRQIMINEPITDLTYTRLAEKLTGRAFFVRPGRRRRRS